MMPPRPNIITGPNCGSVVMPTMTSVPCFAICWTATPLMRAFGSALLRVGHDFVEGRPTASRFSEVELHTADVALVGDVGRDDLEHDGVAHAVGLGLRLVARLVARVAAVAATPASRSRTLGLDFVEEGAALGARLRQYGFERHRMPRLVWVRWGAERRRSVCQRTAGP